MKKILFSILLVAFAFNGKCDFVSYFEIKLKDSVIYNSNTSLDKLLKFERSKISELDLIQINYYECGLSIKNDYELQIHSPNKENEVLFVDEVPQFIFQMSWLLQRQFIGKTISISLLHKKYDQASAKENMIKIVDILFF